MVTAIDGPNRPLVGRTGGHGEEARPSEVPALRSLNELSAEWLKKKQNSNDSAPEVEEKKLSSKEKFAGSQANPGGPDAGAMLLSLLKGNSVTAIVEKAKEKQQGGVKQSASTAKGRKEPKGQQLEVFKVAKLEEVCWPRSLFLSRRDRFPKMGEKQVDLPSAVVMATAEVAQEPPRRRRDREKGTGEHAVSEAQQLAAGLLDNSWSDLGTSFLDEIEDEEEPLEGGGVLRMQSRGFSKWFGGGAARSHANSGNTNGEGGLSTDAGSGGDFTSEDEVEVSTSLQS